MREQYGANEVNVYDHANSIIASSSIDSTELPEALSLTDRRKDLVKNYSGGMKRKIDIAMSLIGNPNILFLDEPTTGLDPQSRKSMWKMSTSSSCAS